MRQEELPTTRLTHASNTGTQSDGDLQDLILRTTLDPRQLKRIEAVHRGFLYQHLYAVGCLLLAQQFGVRVVKVERDEDIELSLPHEQIYLQVKTRAAPLMRSDIQSTLERFALLRAAYAATSERSPLVKASFFIIANVAPNPSLAADVNQPSWPDDVTLAWPDQAISACNYLPPAWADVSQAVEWCAAKARSLPFLTLTPETLIWKLAGCVLLASSGSPPRLDHAFSATELPTLFEQLLVEIQQFPTAPEHYRPQIDEPNLDAPVRIRFVSGFSGAGKTAWASQAALHTAGKVVYFDASNVPGPALHGAVVREIAARFLGDSGRLGSILLPGVTGLDALRLVDQEFARTGTVVTVVLDNAHHASPDDLRPIVTATSVLRFVFLLQPGPGLSELGKALQIEDERLSGWSLDSIAEEVSHLRAEADFITCQRLLEITGGLPLYVQSALHLACDEYNGSVRALCSALDSNSNVAETAQEAILSRLFSGLAREDSAVLAVLSEVECPLKDSEAAAVAQHVLHQNPVTFFASARRLISLGAIQVSGKRRIKIHDALRVLARVRLAEFGDDVLKLLRRHLRDALQESLLRERDLTRLAPFVRLLIANGDVETLIDLANDEMFHEMGLGPEFRATLEQAAHASDLDPRERFWALDSLAFAEFQNNEFAGIASRLDEMTSLIATHGFGHREQLATASKRMLLEAKQDGGNSFELAVQEIEQLAQNDPEALRLHRHNTAVAAFFSGRFDLARRLCATLINEYYTHLGITIDDVFAKNPEDIWPLLTKTPTIGDDLKHLADCLDLDARCCIKAGAHPGLRRIHAFKFYVMANAFRSAIKVGEEYAADCLEFLDPPTARRFIEATLLPAVYKVKLLDRVVPIRSLYALTLARCGEFSAAESEMNRISSFEASLPESDKVDFRARRQGILSLRREHELQVSDSAKPRLSKVGRNDPCPCGSGLKFKRCHAQ